MCKYCEVPTDLAFTDCNTYSVCVSGGRLYVNDTNHNMTESLPIKFCPFCGRKTVDVFINGY